MPDKSNKIHWILAGVLIICVLAYLPTISNGFTNWDDPDQVVLNEDVQELSFSNTARIFSSFYVGMYQPVTTQAYAFIYATFGGSARNFHSFSLLIHLLNIILVFVLVKRFSNHDSIAIITATLFALTPLQVESVAWVSSLSNLLYSAFYLGGIITYLQYVRQRKWRYFIYTLAFFVLSLLSKPSAVTFPVLILFLDLYFRRKVNPRLMLEKLPFFAGAVIVGIIIIFAKEEAGHIIDISERFGWGSRMLMVIYAPVFYIAKLFVPEGLSAFHPYPSEGLDPAFYIAPAIPVMLVFLLFRLRGEARRQTTAGFLFFLLTIAVVIEIIPVGVQVVKERDAYMPSVGIYYMFSTLFLFFVRGRKASRWLPAVTLIIFVAYFSVVTYSRTKTWHDSISLWNDVLDQYPEASAALINRGKAWQAKEDFNRAISDYTLAIQFDPLSARAYYWRGLAQLSMQQFEGGCRDMQRAVANGWPKSQVPRVCQ